MGEICFSVMAEPDGGFTASARVDSHSLVTYGATLDELHTMILELLALYCENSGSKVDTFSLRFAERIPAAA